MDKLEQVYLIQFPTLRKYVTKYKKMQKWIVEFIDKSEIHDDKIARVNSIRITKYINLL